MLSGGAGADKFVAAAAAETGTGAANRDIIIDFSHAQGDRIDAHAIDANTGVPGMQAWSFVSSFTAAGQVRFDAANHLALFDQNGDHSADFSIELSGVSLLAVADFIFA
jgi:Ca2+-binding RTX toxin-like protein